MPDPFPAICVFASAPMRATPSHLAEMSSQILFGETGMVLERRDIFGRFVADFDEYEGWVDLRLFERTDGITKLDDGAIVLTDDLVSEARLCAPGAGGEQNSSHLLPLGSVLPQFENSGFTLNGRRHSHFGSIRKTRPPRSIQELLDYALLYLNAPYVWGGRTPWGIDCSGLVQQAFRAFGFRLPRDTGQQITQGMAVRSLAESQPGDLAFFGQPTNHVGIVFPENLILHASGFVRMDRLTEEGIVRWDTGALTHRLTELRRVTM